MLVEGKCWLNLSQVVRNNKGKEYLLDRLLGSLQLVGFSEAAATWLLANTDSLRLDTLDLIKYLQKKTVEHQEEYLELSKVV